MDKRNWKIYFEWIEGKDYQQLAKEFELSTDTIKTICTAKVPVSIKSKPYMTANSYKRFREWKRSQKDNEEKTS